jgi:signal transduction histidine kinase
MFARFERRVTFLYAAVAATATALSLSVLLAVSLFGYVRLLDETATQTALLAVKYGERAVADGRLFEDAASAFERENARSGIREIAMHNPPRPPDGPPGLTARPGEQAISEGRLGDPPRPQGADRVALFLAESLGAHPRSVPFAGGLMLIAIDAAGLLDAVLLGAACVALAGALAGLGAWIAGRYIAGEALRPLVEVTRALHRFAERDFAPEPIAVAGRSEFDAVAEAYNAAAVQVDAAFLEHEKADERIRRFVADAGHELRTPLTIVLGFTEHVRRATRDGDGRLTFAFEGIEAEGQRMRVLIDNLVLLARLDSEERGFVEPFDLIPLLRELVAVRATLHPNVPVTVHERGDVQIFASRDDVREAVGNVLDNALKYGAGRPVRLTVERIDEARIRLIVADEGPGVLVEQREAIFERFYRGAGSRVVDGSGLGLAIARRAAERAGGRLDLLQPTAGAAGAVFAFELPAGPPASASVPALGLARSA